MTSQAAGLPEAGGTDAFAASERASIWRDTLSNILRQRSAIIGLILLAILFFVAIFAPLIAPYAETTQMIDLGEDVSRQRAETLTPCIHLLGCPTERPQHLFGLDGNTRDVFSRVVLGSRVLPSSPK